MSSLRIGFQEFMQFRVLSERTQTSYLRAVSELARHYKRSPESITTDEIIGYINYLSADKKLSFSTCNIALSAFKCFYNQFLNNGTIVFKVPSRRRPKRLPVVLDKSEVKQVIEVTTHPMYRLALMTAYGSGLRTAELVNLKVCDIDSKRMTIKVCGKGKKDRYTILPNLLLQEFRSYWQLYRPTTWMFYAKKTDVPFSRDMLQKTFARSKKRAGIKKSGGIHILRHCFATHLLEEGTDIRTVQYLLGHSNISTTMVYLHVTNRLISRVVSPLESFDVDNDPPLDPFNPSEEAGHERI